MAFRDSLRVEMGGEVVEEKMKSFILFCTDKIKNKNKTPTFIIFN